VVLRKAEAAALWAFVATKAQAEQAGEKPWSYLLVPEAAVLENATVDGLASAHVRSADADLYARFELQ